MLRLAVCVSILVGCGSASVPPPPPAKPAPVVVATPAPTPAKAEQPIEAQALFTLWLDAFNARDEKGLEEFAKHLAPELAKGFPPPDAMRDFREITGGFDIKKTEEATPRKFVAIVFGRADNEFARVVFELDDTHRAKHFDINIVPM